MEKGIFDKTLENLIIDFLCSKVKFKVKFLEFIKRPAITLFVRYADNSGIDRLPEEIKNDIKPILAAIIEKRYEDARLYLVDLMNKKIDVKKMSEPDEIEMFDYGTKFLSIWLKFLIENKKTGRK